MISGLCLLALLAAAGTADRTGRAGVWLLVATSLLWLALNGEMEGTVLWAFTSSHGLTMADLVGVLGLVLAGWRFLALRSPR